MHLKVRDVMVKEVITANADFTVKHAVEIMCRCGIGCLLVTEGEKAVGIVTERDILRRVVAKEKDPGKTFVGEIMSTPMIVIGPEASLEDAVKLMFRHRIKKLPVVEESSGGARVVGLVTLTDIARMQPRLLEMLRELFAELGEAPPRSMEKVINYYIV
jgi:CBS domain-containing protein